MALLNDMIYKVSQTAMLDAHATTGLPYLTITERAPSGVTRMAGANA
jgi:hypothetical protein